MKILSSLFYKRKSLFCLALAAMFLLLTVPGCAPVGTPAAAEPVQSMQEAEPAPAPAPQTPAPAHEAEAEPPLLFPFRNIRWGMSQQEIAALEGQEPALSDRSPENDLHFDIYDSIDVLGIPMTFIYIFDKVDGLNTVWMENTPVADMTEAEYEAAFQLLFDHISEIYGSYVYQSSDPDGSFWYLFSEKEATLELKLAEKAEGEFSGRIFIEYFPASGLAPVPLERRSLCPFADVSWGVSLEHVIKTMGREPEGHHIMEDGSAYIGYYYTIEMQGRELLLFFGFDELDRLIYLSVSYGEYGEYSRTQFEECYQWFYDLLASAYGEAVDEKHDAELQLQVAFFEGDNETCHAILLDEGQENEFEYAAVYFYPAEEILEPLPFPILAASHGMSPEDMIQAEGREPDGADEPSAEYPEGSAYYYLEPFTDNVQMVRFYFFDERDRLMEAYLSFHGEGDHAEDILTAFDTLYGELRDYYGAAYYPPMQEGSDRMVAVFTGSGFMVNLIWKIESPDSISAFFLPLNRFEFVEG